MRPWLTVDSDDLRHLPKFQGHPRRSKPIAQERISSTFQLGMQRFSEWLDTHNFPVTMFVIADQLEDAIFSIWLKEQIKKHPHLTIGCHGFSHRSWSAWKPDPALFSSQLELATMKLRDFAGQAWRPYFRAPAGYVASWMAPVIAEHGYTIDSSVNQSWLVNNKFGKGENWKKVLQSLEHEGLDVRPWLCRFGLPTCGPALTLPVLRTIARATWKKLDRPVQAKDAEVTVYWHILDHARKQGHWLPPIPIDLWQNKTIDSRQESKQPVSRRLVP